MVLVVRMMIVAPNGRASGEVSARLVLFSWSWYPLLHGHESVQAFVVVEMGAVNELALLNGFAALDLGH